MHNERLKRFRKMAKKHGLILRRGARINGYAAGYELVYRERELYGSADTLRELEAILKKQQSQLPERVGR